jgi:two-component system, chemotaxis family, protein-glutamate methylesterase/glutaminase
VEVALEQETGVRAATLPDMIWSMTVLAVLNLNLRLLPDHFRLDPTVASVVDGLTMNGEIRDESNESTPSDASQDAVFKVVVIGASSGGILAMKHILSALPPDFGAAIAVVQHRASMGPSELSQVLGHSCPFAVRDAEDGESLRPGFVFLAPPDKHLTVGPGGILSLDQSERIHSVRPSADKLFISAAENIGSRVIAVVLGGAGRDGEWGVRVIRRMGGDSHRSG